MLHIVITAGGTVEDIDEVRKITNTSTGQLGLYLCDEVIKYMSQNDIEDYQIHYIVTTTAVKPELDDIGLDHVEVYEVTDTDSVLNAIEKIFSRQKINYFIHSMAVSDFTTNQMMPISQLAEEIANKLTNIPKDHWNKEVEAILKNPDCAVNKERKVSSESDLILTLKRTEKIISKLKKQDDTLFLVGFKLLKNVTEEELIKAANRLAEMNGCDLVLANDLQSISEGNHTGLLIRHGEVIGKYEGKKHIAKAIVYQMMKGV